MKYSISFWGGWDRVINGRLNFYKYFIYILIIFSLSCKDEKSHNKTTSAYKVYNGSVNGRNYVFHLHKICNTSKVIEYSGSYYDEVEQFPYSFASDNFDFDTTHPDQFIIKTSNNKDSIRYFKITFSEDEQKLNGWVLNGTMKNWEATIIDSVAFSATENKEAELFTYSAAAGTVKMFPNAVGSPEYSYTTGMLQPAGTLNTETKNAINQCFLKVLKVPDSVANPVEHIIEKGKSEYFSNYISSSEKDFLDSTVRGPSYFDENKTEVVFSNRKWASLVYSSSYYESGMAHSQFYKSYYVFDMKTGKQMELRDIIKESAFTKVKGILVRNLKKQRGLKPTKTCLTNTKKSPLSDFYITETGIFFHFNPYQIASFAEGDIDVFIPYTELGDELVYNTGNV